jgi:hypothetical protein
VTGHSNVWNTIKVLLSPTYAVIIAFDLHKVRIHEKYFVVRQWRVRKQGNIFMILHLNTVLPHLETLVQNCASCDQTPQHTAEQNCVCADLKQTHAVARKIPIFKIWREECQ